MQASGYSEGATEGTGSSVEGGSASLHDEMQASGQSGSTNGGSSSVGKASASLHDEMQTSGQSGSTNEGSSSVGKASAPLHGEMQAWSEWKHKWRQLFCRKSKCSSSW
ncbi:hypothetical protein C1N68_26635 (plasmid) [Priestia aryabhattai]